MKRRVVVTGLGVISSVGNDVETFWKSLLDGKCGIDFITSYPEEQLAVKIAGTVKDFVPENHGVDKAFTRKHDMFSVYALAAATEAVSDSGIDASETGNIDPFRLGVYFGSGIGGMQTGVKNIMTTVDDPAGKWVSPLFIPAMITNIAAGHIATKFGAKGSCIDITTACATSTHSVGEAFRAIADGYSDAIIAGGSEVGIFPLGLAGFANMKALTKAEDPKHACLPFNADRAGFVMADGAGCLVLEEYEHAKNRGAKIYAEVVGYGTTCDAYHFTAPRPDGTTQARCITDALSMAGYDAQKDNVYINAHGTGTPLNDSAETQAYKIAFGDAAYKCHISSTKSMTGHMLGAAGAVEAIASILALRDGVVPPTINLDNPDPECDLDYTPNVAVKTDLTLALSDSFGFGGHNGCVAFRKVED